MKITAPAAGFTGTTHLGPYVLKFEDGAAEVDDLNDGAKAYLRANGYGLGSKSATAPDGDPEPADPRDLDAEVVGTPLRDAAVDPEPGDFLAPTNAGDANPHGPDVVAPGIHAVAGPGPIVPGTVGSADYQDAKESATTEAVLVKRLDATEVGNALGRLAGEEYKKTGEDGMAVEVDDLDDGDVEEVIDESGQEPEQVEGTEVESDTAGTGQAENTETGEVTEPGEPLPEVDASAYGEDSQPIPPAGNASRDAWAEYAKATGNDPGDLTRDELRDRFGPKA